MRNRILNKLKKQKAVYWANPVNDGFGGYTYDAPVQLMVLWEDKQEKFMSVDMEELLSSSVVHTNQDVEIGGMISLMALADLSSSELPADNDAIEIKAFNKTPDHRGVTFSRKAWL